MKHIFEYLFSKKFDMDKIKIKTNRFHITRDDMIGELKGFPVGVVVRMLEETEWQGNKPDVKVFQHNNHRGKGLGGFKWSKTNIGHAFWEDVIFNKNFDKFYKEYPEYKKYDI